MNIMIVDDEKLLRKGFSVMTNWSEKGIYVIGEAMNGADALEQIKNMKTRPDVVLSDICMPIMDGVELTRQLKQLYPEIAVIILSGYDDYQYVRDSMKYGASDYLLKATIDIDEIYDALQKIKLRAASPHELVQTTDQEENQVIHMDQNKIKKHLELQEFDELQEYICILITKNSHLKLSLLHELLRDLFFFIEYTLDVLGTLTHYMKDKKYINSTAITLVKDVPTALEWVNLILCEIARHCTPVDDGHKEIINQVQLYIEEHFTEPISLSHIADHFYMNKNYLCDLFKAKTQMTINEYITDLRIEKAKAMIRKTTGSLNEISEASGYPNHSYFGKVFRKKTGISPSEYMKLYR